MNVGVELCSYGYNILLVIAGSPTLRLSPIVHVSNFPFFHWLFLKIGNFYFSFTKLSLFTLQLSKAVVERIKGEGCSFMTFHLLREVSSSVDNGSTRKQVPQGHILVSPGFIFVVYRWCFGGKIGEFWYEGLITVTDFHLVGVLRRFVILHLNSSLCKVWLH